MLHITNGDIAAQLIRASEIAGDVVPWRDVLHEGPVPSGLSLEALSDVRARFIQEAFGTEEDVFSDFRQRDQKLTGSWEDDEVTLWFEADLYDQLQLLQVLDWYASHAVSPPRLTLICIGAHPAFSRFDGLGQLSPTQMGALFPDRQDITSRHLNLATRAWAAFRAPTPLDLVSLLNQDTSHLPFLAAALHRHLEDYPSVHGGLGRTERQIAQVVSTGETAFIRIFPTLQGMEERVYMGDVTVWARMLDLTRGPQPALSFSGESRAFPPNGNARIPPHEFRLTEWGAGYLSGTADQVRTNGIERWMGGVHLSGRDAAWRWDPEAGRVVHR